MLCFCLFFSNAEHQAKFTAILDFKSLQLIRLFGWNTPSKIKLAN